MNLRIPQAVRCWQVALLNPGGNFQWQDIQAKTVQCFINLQEMLKTGAPGGAQSVKRLPLAQVLIPGSLLRGEPASPSASAPDSLAPARSLSLLLR